MKKIFYGLALGGMVGLLAACGEAEKTSETETKTTTTQETEQEVNEDELGYPDDVEVKPDAPTTVKGNLPPVQEFFVLDKMTNGDLELSDLQFLVMDYAASPGYYWMIWGDMQEENRIMAITEKEKGQFYLIEAEEDNETTFYRLEKEGDDGLWTLIDPERKGVYAYLVDKKQKANFESASGFDVIKEKGLKWVALSENEGEWVIYNECMYGSGGLYFDENGEWLEFSGGGDAYSNTIVDIADTEGGIEIIFRSGISGTENSARISFIGDNILVLKNPNGEERFVLGTKTETVKTIEEECDEEDY